MIPVILCVVAFVASLAAIVMAPKIWQRVIALLVVGVIIFMFTQSAIVIGKKGLMAWHFGRNIRPTDQLWSIVKQKVEAGLYAEAQKDLVIISTNWSKIGAWPKSYSAQDILNVIEQQRNSEPNIGQVSPEAAPSASPDEPSM